MKRLSILTSVFFVTLFMFQAPAYAAIPVTEQSSAIRLDLGPDNLQGAKSETIQKKGKLSNIFIKGDKQHFWASIIMAILIPFVGVAIWQDGLTRDFLLTFVLTLLLYVPGLIYALSLILR